MEQRVCHRVVFALEAIDVIEPTANAAARRANMTQQDENPTPMDFSQQLQAARRTSKSVCFLCMDFLNVAVRWY